MVIPSQDPTTILLVDDDAALRTALTFMLELDGFKVEAFASGEELLACDLPDVPTCLVLDHNLLGMTGLDTVALLRARGVRTPAVLITSHPGPALRAKAAAIDVVIVEKPLLNDALKFEIDEMLSREADRSRTPR